MDPDTTDPQGGGAPASEPAATPAETTPAPVETEGAAPTTEQPPKQPTREERRFAVLTAKLATESRERERLAVEVEALRRAAPKPEAAPIDPKELPAVIEAEARKIAAAERTRERVEAFHAAGRQAYPDWGERCSSLIQMGADPQFAELLVEMPEGPKLAAALADEPEELERIAGLKTERARAIALGRFAATIETRPAAPAPAPRVTKLADPIRPVTGRATVTHDESRMTSAQLVDFYTKQAMAKRGL